MSIKIKETNLEISSWFKTIDKLDVWITDPPYPFNNQNGTGRYSYNNGSDNMYSRMTWQDLEDVYKEMFSYTNDGGRLYTFCNRDGLIQTLNSIEKVGWSYRNLLIWDKQSFGGGYYWRNQVEYIIYATKESKDKSKTFVKTKGNVFNYSRPTKKDIVESIGYNPKKLSAKPKEIWEDIISEGVFQDEVIADPFAGTNPMRAALLLNNNLLNKISLAYTNVY